MSRSWLFAGWLGLVGLVGCDRKGGGGSTAERAAAFTRALRAVRESAANAAQAAECALTAGARLPVNKERLFFVLDAAEGATGACDRAAAELVRLDAQCRDRWDATCDYLMARIASMADTAKDRVGLACGTPQGPADAAGH